MWDDGRSGDVHRLKKIKLYLAFAPGYCYSYSYARAPTPLCPYAPISYEFISVPYPTGNQILRSEAPVQASFELAESDDLNWVYYMYILSVRRRIE